MDVQLKSALHCVDPASDAPHWNKSKENVLCYTCVCFPSFGSASFTDETF